MKVPSYRLHAQTGQAVVVIRGKHFYLGRHGTKESKSKYNRLIAEYLASDKSPAFGKNADTLLVKELLFAFIQHAKKFYGDGRTSEYVRMKPALRIVRKLYGDTLAESFGPKEYKAVRAYLANEPSQRETIATKDKRKRRTRRYVNKLAKYMVVLFKWAAVEQLVPVTIYQLLTIIPPLQKGRCDLADTEPVKPVPDDVVDATLPHLPPVVRDMVEFQQIVGCRPGEVCGITPGMVDRSTDVWEVHLTKHKTAWRGKKRTIYVGPKAQDILRPYLLRSSDAYCFSPIEADKQRRQARHEARVTPLSCGNKPGSKKTSRPARPPKDHYITSSYARAITYACEKAWPAPKDATPAEKKAWLAEHSWSPNQLRHSMATKIRKSDGLEAAAVMLGHSEVAVTQVYAEADRTRAIDVARRIG